MCVAIKEVDRRIHTDHLEDKISVFRVAAKFCEGEVILLLCDFSWQLYVAS